MSLADVCDELLSGSCLEKVLDSLPHSDHYVGYPYASHIYNDTLNLGEQGLPS